MRLLFPHVVLLLLCSCSLLLSRKQQQGSAGAKQQLQGIPRTDAIGNYFVLSKVCAVACWRTYICLNGGKQPPVLMCCPACCMCCPAACALPCGCLVSQSGGKFDFVVQPLETTFTFKQLAGCAVGMCVKKEDGSGAAWVVLQTSRRVQHCSHSEGAVLPLCFFCNLLLL